MKPVLSQGTTARCGTLVQKLELIRGKRYAIRSRRCVWFLFVVLQPMTVRFLWQSSSQSLLALAEALSLSLLSSVSSPLASGGLWLITGSIARSATRRYLIYSEADGGEIWHEGPSSVPNFTPSVQRLGYRTPNTIFYWDLIKMWNINTPQGCIPSAIFIKFAEFIPRFRCVSC